MDVQNKNTTADINLKGGINYPQYKYMPYSYDDGNTIGISYPVDNDKPKNNNKIE